MPEKPKWYVVWVGRNPGIYSTWADCEKQVKGFFGARFKSYPSQKIAALAFSKPPLWEPDPVSIRKTNRSVPQRNYLCVDAACSGSPGPLEWRVVELPANRTVLRKGPFTNGSNNIGEFLALVDAIRYRDEKHLQMPIYTDSVTALAWLRAKKCKTTLPVRETNPRLFELIQQAEAILRGIEPTREIYKWDTEKWGEIPADYGRK